MLKTIVALLLVTGSIATASDVNVSRATCLKRDASDWNDVGTSSILNYLGCFFAAPLNVSRTDSAADENVTVRYSPDAPINFTLACGAYCLMVSPSRTGQAQFVATDDGKCRCILTEYFMGSRPGANASEACPQIGQDSVRLYSANPPCPIMNGKCATGSCAVTDGCCIAASGSDEPDSVPSLYMAMAQWAVGVIILMALVEAVVYSVVRYRYRNVGGNFGDDALMRSKEDADRLGQELLSTFPPVSSSPLVVGSTNQDPDAADACVICLEDLTALPSAKLPCGHVLHTHCLREYLSHKLVHRNTVQCPTCRGTIADTAQA